MNDPSTRRLAAVWFADIVGYTRVSSSDEARALELVSALQALAKPVVERRGGRVVKFLGDAVMTEFTSCEAAVEAALDLVDGFGRATSGAGAAQLRVGAHLGELAASGDGDIYGDVVNTAARLQAAAEPDQVLVSEDVWRQLRRRPSLAFAELGPRTLKGKDEPLVTFAATRRYHRPVASDPVGEARAEGAGGRRRLVVLPFQVLRPDPEVDFLAFGLPDAVASSLMGLRSLVIRTAPRLPADKGAIDPREVARAAGVDLILSGSVQRLGERVRVTAQLAEGSHGTLLWNHAATLTLGDLFEIQDELTSRIVEALEKPLSAEERENVTRDVPASGEAYRLYLRANEAAVHGSSWEEGARLYREALALDPDYAPAWARLGRCHRLLAKYAAGHRGADADRSLAEEAFGRALEINPELALAHSLYAQLQVEDGRPVEGLVRLLRRAARHPTEVDLFVGLTHATRYCGLSAWSLAAHARAVELDPEARTSVAYTWLQRGDYEAALASSPAQDPSRLYALQSLGRTGEALAWPSTGHAGGHEDTLSAFRGAVLAALAGDRAGVLEHSRRAVAFPDPEGRYFVARCLAGVGAEDEALDVLEGVVRDGFCCADGVRTDPLFGSLRGTPGMGALLEAADAARAAATEAFLQERGAVVLGDFSPP